jgi:hypothetical protein
MACHAARPANGADDRMAALDKGAENATADEAAAPGK